jgi:hypothetical protein
MKTLSVFLAAAIVSASPFASADTVPAGPPRPYEHMRLVDLKVRQKEMVGGRVLTSGLVQPLGEMIMLESEPVDTDPLSLDITRLRSEDRQRILTRCADGCRVDVAGTMVDGRRGLELRADGIEIK